MSRSSEDVLLQVYIMYYVLCTMFYALFPGHCLLVPLFPGGAREVQEAGGHCLLVPLFLGGAREVQEAGRHCLLVPLFLGGAREVQEAGGHSLRDVGEAGLDAGQQEWIHRRPQVHRDKTTENQANKNSEVYRALFSLIPPPHPPHLL